jgi:hypothetical protein
LRIELDIKLGINRTIHDNSGEIGGKEYGSNLDKNPTQNSSKSGDVKNETNMEPARLIKGNGF